MTKMWSLLVLLCCMLSAPVNAFVLASDDDAQDPKASSGAPAINPVVEWNKTLLTIVRTPGAQSPTVHSTRSFAILHAAIYDAVNNIDRTHQPYLVRIAGVPRHASKEAAADAAAHDALTALYPKFQATLDAELQQLLAQIPDGEHKTQGIEVGEAVASRLLALRSNDGSSAPPIPFVFGAAPGDYQSTPPNFPPQPQFTHWSHVTPFALESANQFRLGPPPAVISDVYRDAFNEVKSLGIANGTTASADQQLTGRFWNGAIQNYWNEIAQTASLAHHLTVAQTARLFALLNLTLADEVIAFYDTKYTYNFWRPVTAIRAGDSDGNPETVGDPNWLPEVKNTTPDPSYPGAHAVISAGADVVLESFFDGDHFNFNVTSEVLPGVERSFTSFSAADDEATLSRIFAGVHFRPDLTSGRTLGREVAGFVLNNFLLPKEDSDNDR